MISIQRYIPKTLFPLIKSFWCLKVSDSLKSPYEEDIIPDGHHEIIFHLDSNPAKRKTENGEWLCEPDAFFAGQDLKSFRVRLNPGSTTYGIRFHPHTQALFFDFPAITTTDFPLSLTDVGKSDLLWSYISDCPKETFSNFEKYFLKRIYLLNYSSSSFNYVNHCVQEILNHKGNIKIDFLVKKIGISGKHLGNSFKKFVGVSPKTFCSIIKFNHFINYKKNNPSKTLTECALEANFYDQSHLINLSNTITGKSPKAYFGKINCINDFFIDV